MTFAEPLLAKQISRINVIGTSGSGKSTFAQKLSQALRYPYIEMDQLFWLPNWQKPTDEVFFAKLRAALAQDKYVLDGNYTRTVPFKWENIEMVIWLDYSFARTLWQSVRRAIARALSQKELWEGTGNRESFRQTFFSKKSVLWWMITSHKKVRERTEAYIVDPRFAHIQFVRLRSHREAAQFLKRFSST